MGKKTVLTSEPDSIWEYLQKVWQHRSLIWVFGVRDLRVKYAQTVIGLGWTILQPLTALGIFTFFFGYILNWEANGLPYSLYIISGLLGWNFFAYIVYQGTNAAHESGTIIKKIYFPKAVLPLSKVGVALVELGVSLIILVLLLLWHSQAISWHIIFIPFFLFFNALAALFIVFFFSSLGTKNRDVYHLVPYLMYFGIWFTPVFFNQDVLPEQLRFLWYLNPIASIVEGWRWCLFPNWGFDLYYIPGLLVIIPLFLLGVSMYKKAESKISDFV